MQITSASETILLICAICVRKKIAVSQILIPSASETSLKSV